MRYRYAALVFDTGTGTWGRQTGEIVVASDPIEELRTQNRKPISVTPVRFRIPRILPWQGISSATLKVWYDQMASLTHLPPAKAVAICAQRSDGNMRKLLVQLEGELANESLHEAMAKHPEIPDHHVAQVSVLRTQSKDVQMETWTTLSEMVTSEAALKKKFFKAIRNVAAMIIGGFFVLYIIGNTIAPGVESFTASIANSAVKEPPETTTARFIVGLVAGPVGISLAIATILGIVAYSAYIRINESAAEQYERALFGLPYFGKIVRMIETARIARAFGPLYLASTADAAVGKIANVSSRLLIRRELQRVKRSLSGLDPSGKTDLPSAFSSDLLDPLLSQYLVAVGSGSAMVAGACRKVGLALERDAFSRLDQWLEEVEPWLSWILMTTFYLLLSSLMLPFFDALNVAVHTHPHTYYVPTK